MNYNPKFTYPHMELWFDEHWTDKNSVIDPLFQWMGRNDERSPRIFRRPEGDPLRHPDYKKKSNSVDLREVMDAWLDKGLVMTTLEQGWKYWISMVPQHADMAHPCRLLVVVTRQDGTDPWWAMEVQERYHTYNERAAVDGDTIIVYLTADGPDEDRIFGNILQEACVLYPVDLSEVYLDVSLPLSKGQKLSEIEDFHWVDLDGQPLDPDSRIELLWGDIPVLPMSERWGSRESLTRGLVMHQQMNEGRFDREWLIHSEAGAKMAEGIWLEHRFNSIYDPGYEEYWHDKGLRFDVHEYAGRRYLVFAPAETDGPLPLVLALQEVYRGNEHLAVTAASYFNQLTELAAEGNFIALFFVLEDPDANELLMDIMNEAMSMYSIDPARVYAMGHSHDGWFTRFFGFRHPDKLAGIATLGNYYGLPTAEAVGNDKMGISDEEAAYMEKYDMPLVVINGENEPMATYPLTKEEQISWARDWQRRLRASRCPVKSMEEILGVRESGSEAEFHVGVPGDRSMTIWSDGFASYIVDTMNVDGRYHLRAAATQNMPHTVTPPMIDIAWGFLRQFARDPKTGEVIELCQV